MMFSMTVDEAIALVVAGEAVKLNYELEGKELDGEAYLSLKAAVEKVQQQLWSRKAAE